MGTRSPGRGNGVCERRFHVKQGEADHLAGDHLAGNPDIISAATLLETYVNPRGQGLRDHGLTAPALAWVMVTTTSPPGATDSGLKDRVSAGAHSSPSEAPPTCILPPGQNPSPHRRKLVRTNCAGRGNGVCERRFHVKQGEANHLAGDHLAGNPDIIGGEHCWKRM